MHCGGTYCTMYGDGLCICQCGDCKKKEKTMPLPPIVRRAIYDRMHTSGRRGEKPGSATTEIIVRLTVDPARIRNRGGRERQLNLTAREITCLDPLRITLFSNKDRRRRVRLIVNRRRAYLLSVTESGILVFTYKKLPN